MLRLALFFILANIIQQSTGSLANRNTPNQCDQLGLTTLQLITAIIPELNSKLQRIHDDQLALKTNQIAMQSSLEAQRTRKLARTEDLEELRTQLDAQFLAIQRKLDEQQTTHRESSSNTITREDFEARFNETEDHFHEIQSTLAKLDVPAENPRETHLTNYSKPIPPKFQKIGDRYFYIENNITATWFKAAATCHQMGGYLAGIKTQKELFTIQTYLEDNADSEV
ncbi:uncharacterized protein LOC119555864 [Drosophila subpulchrella]|uniref:uncharacterized protein LOC119555864 n=1 Tax=Drosophila subpulchrella TaxID=1486046 RepID=UPI0018A174E0|nr:uncharacterized protein LOC119555864 [Drosophila subpulchrella]